jgi:uncharacterized phage protein gp47/JayE
VTLSSPTPVPPNNLTPAPAGYPTLTIPTNIDYTSKDFAGLVYSMLNYAATAMPDWNTSSQGDFGVALLQCFAYAGDILSYYGDRITQEAYLPTATQRLSLLNIAQLLGYTVSNGAAATGTVTFQTTDPGVAVTIPVGTQVSGPFDTVTDQPVIYETTEVVTCAANGGTVTATVSQGVTYNQILLGNSNGSPGFIVAIPQTGVIDGSVQVFVQTAGGIQQWAFSQYLIDNGPDDLAFTIYTDASGVTWIQFGDNINGAIPGTGMNIYATYIIGAGSAGNCSAGTVGTIVTPLPGIFIPLEGDGITFQSSVMAGGADPESNELIRANAPQTFQAQFRAVSPADFEALVFNVPGVTAANAVSLHSTSVTLYVLGPAFQAPTTQLSDNILDYFEGRTLSGVTLAVGVPSLIPIDVGSNSSPITLQVQPNYLQVAVENAVLQAVTNLFQPPNSSFGEFITVGQVYQTIMAVAGVEYVIIPIITREDVTQTNTNPIQLRQSEIAVPGNLYINASGGL